VRLPDRFTLQNGWPKAILREVTAGQLPDAVRWRRGKEHLGWAFTSSLVQTQRPAIADRVHDSMANLDGYLIPAAISPLKESLLTGAGDIAHHRAAFNALCLAEWIRAHSRRPISATIAGNLQARLGEGE
jgi:hypothetical protein